MNDEYSKWQSIMSQKVIICKDEDKKDNDTNDIQDTIEYVGGFDTSMCKMDHSHGVAALIVIKMTPSCEIVYEDYENVFFDLQDQEQMYIPGMLGRREVPAYLKLLSREDVAWDVVNSFKMQPKLLCILETNLQLISSVDQTKDSNILKMCIYDIDMIFFYFVDYFDT